jgi:capsular exopolysaccharide synthesis family protein
MSRIHEALKKAEEERAINQAPGVAALPIDQATVVPVRGNVVQTVPPQHATQAASAPVPGDYLRFDHLVARCAHPHWNMDPNVNVFLAPDQGAHGAEQFRTLRSRLYQLRNSQPLGILLVTSSVPGEGKTFVASNLAHAIVRQPDRRALIIDGDLRCSRLHVQLGAPAAPGLSDYLLGEADDVAVIQHGQEGNLCFIPGGKEVANPSELLSNGRLKILLDRMKPVFDWVILDSPPCLPVADASLLADLCDGILMIVRAGMTPSATAQRAARELAGRKVLGVVLNAVDKSHAYGSYYYQNYGYGRSDSEDLKKTGQS